jgi:hypothetical protein
LYIFNLLCQLALSFSPNLSYVLESVASMQWLTPDTHWHGWYDVMVVDKKLICNKKEKKVFKAN